MVRQSAFEIDWPSVFLNNWMIYFFLIITSINIAKLFVITDTFTLIGQPLLSKYIYIPTKYQLNSCKSLFSKKYMGHDMQ